MAIIMAGKVRHVVNRSGRYHARLVVPKELRGIVGKTELRTPLGWSWSWSFPGLMDTFSLMTQSGCHAENEDPVPDGI